MSQHPRYRRAQEQYERAVRQWQVARRDYELAESQGDEYHARLAGERILRAEADQQAALAQIYRMARMGAPIDRDSSPISLVGWLVALMLLVGAGVFVGLLVLSLLALGVAGIWEPFLLALCVALALGLLVGLFHPRRSKPL